MPVSVLLLTFNESENIERCLKGLDWCDDIWVLDSGSTDDTVARAEAAGAHVAYKEWLGFAGARNFALDNLPLKHDWVLHLDSDEYVSRDLRNEILSIANGHSPQDAVAFEVPFQMLFMGRWLRYGGTFPNPQVRFGRKDALHFVQAGHGQREKLAFGRLARTTGRLYHFNFSKGIASWQAKHIGYAREEAGQHLGGGKGTVDFVEGLSVATRLRRRLRHAANRIPGHSLLRFFYMYIFRLGFLDGAAGFHYAVLMSCHEYFISMHVREMKHDKDNFDIGKIPPAER